MGDMAVRSVLLSEIQSVLSIARRRYGYALVHQGGKNDQDEPQGGIFHSFALLRARLLRCEELVELNPSSVLRPFLDLIRHEHTSSTLTGAALESVQHFLQCWDWSINQASVPDMLADIVDAVGQCRFQETNAESDQHVLVLVVHVLQAVLMCPAADKLSDHAMWQLVEALYALSRANRNDPHITLSLRASATSVLSRAIEFIFQSSSVYVGLGASSGAAAVSMDASFGLPCAVKILGFLCQKLQPRGTTTTMHSPGTSSALLPTRREVLLSFMLLQRVLVTCDAQQFSHTSSLMLFIKDDLCGSILRYGRLGASSDLKIPVLCLSIIRLLWTKLRPLLKMQLEALFNGVFCHTLHWTIAHLDLAHPIFPNNLDSSASPSNPAQQDNGANGFMYVDAVREEFTGEIVPLNKLFSISFEILDCLVDILAEPTLLPDLYVNYDCDGNRSDLAHNVFELLSRVVTQTHHACQETSDEVHFLWAQAAGELALRGLFNALYVIYSRSQNTKSIVAQDVNSGGSAEQLHIKRQRKKLFQHGIQEFNRKPLSGIKYLQQNSFLPTPLDPKSLAAFLRSLPPGLNKVAVGIYLGAMGKEVKDFEKSDIHEADTIEFHREVLEHFVRSFNFESDSIVAALRMFLASFRLPGEAQQIDRILNTFSIQVYEQCRDRFLMASPDVAYLLSFSLIMLNTDLHNPNIRPEKKMKLEDFMKNNRNYGEEVSKNRDLPDDFMTELYDAIAKEEIKTREDDSKHGEVTTDRWKDLLYQAENDPSGSRLVVHHSASRTTQSRTASQNGSRSSSPRRYTSQEDSPRRRELTYKKVKSTSSLMSSSFGDSTESSDLARDLLRHRNDVDTGHQYDRDIFNIMLAQLKAAFSSVFQQFVDVANGPNGGLAERSTGSTDGRGMNLPEDTYLPDKAMLQLACNGFVLCAATASSHKLLEDFNELFASVAKFSGLYASDVYPVAYNGKVNGISLYCHNQSAPVATAAMLKIVGSCGGSIQKDGWKHFFHAISALREFDALPDRFLHGSFGSSDTLLTSAECEEFLDLVCANREELERREAMRLKEAERTQSSSGFFSGVAWLMSALDTTSNGSVPNAPSPSGSRRSQMLSNGTDVDRVVLNPVEKALDARDLLVKTDVTRPVSNPLQQNGFGTSGWILQTLQPYRVEKLIEVLAVLPTSAQSEIVQALHDELVETLTGSPKSALSSKRRTSTFPGNGQSSSPTDELSSRAPPGNRSLSPAGCVLFEHVLSRLLAALPRDSIADRVNDLWNALEVHYLKLPSLVRPILLKNVVVNGVGYDCAAYVVEKAIEGLLSLVLKDRSEKTLGLLMSLLTALVDISADDEDVLRPYLTLIFTGLKRVADAIDLRTVHFERGEWLTVSNLIGWATEQPHASVHAFAFLEKLIASEVWLADVETTFTLMELYTKTLLFALQKEYDSTTATAHVRWPQRRPLELLTQLFERLHENETEVEEEERLRQIGGMVLLCRHALRSSNPPDGEQISYQVNEKAISSLEFLRSMIISTRSRATLTGSAWLEVLGSGLLTISSELLNRKSKLQETNRRRLSSEDGGLVGPLLFFERNVPKNLALVPASHDLRDGSAKDKAQSGRRRRPSVVKDPLALRPHILIVEMVSWVACEQLDQLLLLPRFAAVWDELLDELLAFVELTKPVQRSNQGVPNEEMLAALERRSIMSAHEEIVEHVKSIIRRLTVLLHSHDKKSKANAGEVGGNSSALAGASFHALMHVLVEKCQSKGPAFYDQLFPSQDDATSTGERTPPIEEEEEVAHATEEGDLSERLDEEQRELHDGHSEVAATEDDSGDTPTSGVEAVMEEAVALPVQGEAHEDVSVQEA